MAVERTDKKETPPKGCLRKYGNEIPRLTAFTRNDSVRMTFPKLLIERSSNVNRTSNCTTYHGVVTDAEESHHLNVCWN